MKTGTAAATVSTISKKSSIAALRREELFEENCRVAGILFREEVNTFIACPYTSGAHCRQMPSGPPSFDALLAQSLDNPFGVPHTPTPE
jgi:hypothetical protein